MTNREQIASTIGFTECGDRSVVAEISRMLAEADVAVLGVEDMDRLTTWMGLECDEDNEWGKLEPRTEVGDDDEG